MFPKAPDVSVFAPTTVFAGRTAELEVVVDATQPVRIDYIDVRITGHEGWRVGSGKHAVTVRMRHPELVARLHEGGELAVGTSRFRTSFELPGDMPPSHQISPAWANLEVYVRVAIPWWPDGRYKFTVPVRRPPPPDVARTPIAIRSSADAGEPRIELSLASTRLVAGETVVGSVAVFHLDDDKPRTVALTMTPSFVLYGRGRDRSRTGDTLGIDVTIPAGGAGTSVPFHFKLPADITPTFRATSHELAWSLEAKTGSFFGRRVAVPIPIEICDASAAALTEKLRLRAVPRLSDERISSTFDELARAHGWRTVTDDDDVVDGTQLVVEGDAGDATLRLAYVYLGEAGAFLFSSVRLPSLGLALNVKPSTGLFELLSSDIEIDLATWDRKHNVEARSPAQVIPFLRAAVPAVLAATSVLGPLRSWTDDEIVLSRPIADVEPTALANAKHALEQLAAALAAVPIAPPNVEVDLDAWRALAQRLAGRVTPGDLTIEGTLDQLPVEVVLELDGERARRVRAYVGDPLRTSNTEPLSAQELADWPADFSEPAFTHGVLGAALAIDAPGKTPFIDVVRVRELVTALRALLARREPSGGPFR